MFYVQYPHYQAPLLISDLVKSYEGIENSEKFEQEIQSLAQKL